MVRILSYGIAALLLGAGAAYAETSLADDSGTVSDTSFEDVSAGNLGIASALFEGQSGETADPPSDGETATAWSMDDILQAKQDGQGWGQIFKQMKADGATDARNLGELVSRYKRGLNGSLGAEDGGLARNFKNPKAGDSGDGEAVTSAASGGDGSESSAESPADGPDVKVGAYKELSPGGRKIADSLFDAQSIGPEGKQAWSLDQIATAKQDGRGWGEIFKQIKSDGLTDARNLGQLVSGRHHLNQTATATAGSREAAATKGSGRSSSAGGKHGIGTASRARRNFGGGGSGRSPTRGIVTASGGSAAAGARVSASSGGGSGNGGGTSKARGRVK